jgi:hypothetical protein
LDDRFDSNGSPSNDMRDADLNIYIGDPASLPQATLLMRLNAVFAANGRNIFIV